VNAVRGIVVVLLGLGGLVLVASSHPRLRRPVLRRRLAPYLGALAGRSSTLLGTASDTSGAGAVLTPVFEPVLRVLGSRLHRMLDDGRELAMRLRAAGWDLDVSGFRSHQVTAGLTGVIAGLALGLMLGAAGRPVSPVAILVLAACLGVVGIAWRDQQLRRAVERRAEAIRIALPTVVDLVCLSVTAGESLRSAVALVADSATGPLPEELRSVLRTSRGGVPLVEALAESARVTAVDQYTRFVDAITAAQARGLPLADTMRALAFDLREQQKRDLIEVAGKKQVSMLVPVIALILPVAIVFAFFPGVVAIRTLAR
jgi:tight adherence protein C